MDIIGFYMGVPIIRSKYLEPEYPPLIAMDRKTLKLLDEELQKDD